MHRHRSEVVFYFRRSGGRTDPLFSPLWVALLIPAALQVCLVRRGGRERDEGGREEGGVVRGRERESERETSSDFRQCYETVSLMAA